jgi:hypothetical protein
MTLLIEWLGTFFLAVEAIKLNNLTALRLGMRRWIGLLDPGTKADPDAPDAMTRAISVMYGQYSIFFVLIGGSVLALIAYLLSLWPLLLAYCFSFSTLWMWAVGILALGAFGMVAAPLGVGIVLAFLFVLRSVIFVLLFVEKKTASGIVGIMGFVMFSVAAILKLLEH